MSNSLALQLQMEQKKLLEQKYEFDSATNTKTTQAALDRAAQEKLQEGINNTNAAKTNADAATAADQMRLAEQKRLDDAHNAAANQKEQQYTDTPMTWDFNAGWQKQKRGGGLADLLTKR
jgi:hypothetical protein